MSAIRRALVLIALVVMVWPVALLVLGYHVGAVDPAGAQHGGVSTQPSGDVQSVGSDATCGFTDADFVIPMYKTCP